MNTTDHPVSCLDTRLPIGPLFIERSRFGKIPYQWQSLPSERMNDATTTDIVG